MDISSRQFFPHLEGRVVENIWPYLTGEYQKIVNFDASVGEFWDAMGSALEGASVAGYRVPEELLKAVEEECDDLSYAPDSIDRWIATRFLDKIRAFDDVPASVS